MSAANLGDNQAPSILSKYVNIYNKCLFEVRQINIFH